MLRLPGYDSHSMVFPDFLNVSQSAGKLGRFSTDYGYRALRSSFKLYSQVFFE